MFLIKKKDAEIFIRRYLPEEFRVSITYDKNLAGRFKTEEDALDFLKEYTGYRIMIGYLIKPNDFEVVKDG